MKEKMENKRAIHFYSVAQLIAVPNFCWIVCFENTELCPFVSPNSDVFIFLISRYGKNKTQNHCNIAFFQPAVKLILLIFLSHKNIYFDLDVFLTSFHFS